MSMYPEIEWHSVDDRPEGQCSVLIMAARDNYQFGYPQLFAGWFVEKYYDTVINEFRITDQPLGKWTPIMWAYAPKTPLLGRQSNELR
jgi:hypothetical protein